MSVVELLEKKMMMKQSRGGHRAHVTRIMKETEELLKRGEAEKKEEILLDIDAELISNKESLKEKLGVLKRLDEEILELTTEQKEQEDEIADAGTYNKSINKTLVVIDRWRKKYSGEAIVALESNIGHAAASETSTAAQGHTYKRITPGTVRPVFIPILTPTTMGYHLKIKK